MDYYFNGINVILKKIDKKPKLILIYVKNFNLILWF